MMGINLATWVGKAVAAAIAIVLIIGFFMIRGCIQANQRAVHSNVDRGQAGAASNSAVDAISTQGNVSGNATASEATTARNREDIRNAQGADQRIDPAVRNAGFASLCKRAGFRATASGRVRCTPSGGVAPAR